jgi:hypothetical protein
MDMFSGVLGLIVILFLFVLAVLWFFLPFAIFGTKDKLAALIVESKKANVELARVVAELAATRAEMAQTHPLQNGSGSV